MNTEAPYTMREKTRIYTTSGETSIGTVKYAELFPAMLLALGPYKSDPFYASGGRRAGLLRAEWSSKWLTEAHVLIKQFVAPHEVTFPAATQVIRRYMDWEAGIRLGGTND